MEIVKEKIKQIGPLLDELDVDLWLVFVRETAVHSDPILPLVVGLEATWQSFFAYCRDGRSYALIGNLDEADYLRSGNFTQVIPYTTGVGEDLRSLLSRLDPRTIAINYSLDNPSADGLSYGLYLRLLEYLKGTPYADRLISAEAVCTKVRARKTQYELKLLEAANKVACDVWREAVTQVRTGMTEAAVAGLIDGLLRGHGAEPSFETIVNAGAKTQPGHGSPTDARLEPGDLLHIDFGARIFEYCSDIQRVLYFRRPGEDAPPEELTEAFAMVNSIITNAAKNCRPGVKGHEVDAGARATLVDDGYVEYQHALGHQLGRAVHDGGALIGPKWERYGKAPDIELEAGNVFTLELEINLPGIGCVGLEEDVVVEPNGARIFGTRQTELDVK